MNDAISLIPIGRDNVINRHNLTRAMILAGFISEESKDANREMMDILHNLRREYLIIASGHGYYRPANDEIAEIKAYIAKEKHRLKEINSNLKFAEKYYADLKAGRLN